MLGMTKLAAATLGVMVGGAALAATSQPGGTSAPEAGVYRGYVDTRSPRGPMLITLRIDSVSSNDEVQAIEATLRDRGQEAMFAALAKVRPNGWLNLEHDLGYPVTVLGEQQTTKGRRVVALVGRPLRFDELFWGARSADWPFTLVVLDLDGSGRGHGTLVPAARADVDKQGNLTFDDYLRVPYRIIRVRPDATTGS
jgi:hypothetical protein